jgi:hypothetical protein
MPRSFDAMMSGAMTHIAVPRSETSTTDGSPVRSRRKSAGRDPAGDRHPARRVAERRPLHHRRAGAGGVSAFAIPPRHQNDAAS